MNLTHETTPDCEAPQTASEALFALITAARALGLRTDPSDKDPWKVVNEGDVAGLPQRVFRLVAAIECFEAADRGEVEQILDAAVTMLSLKLALYSVLGWIAAQGLPTKEVAQMVLQAVSGPIKPNGSLAKLKVERAKLMDAMGAAAPKMTVPGGA